MEFQAKRALVFGFLLFSGFAHAESLDACGQALVENHSANGPIWRPVELSYLAQGTYDDPFDRNRVQFSGRFTSPTGKVLTMPGYWNGQNVWKIRFAPTEAGTWKIQTRVIVSTDGVTFTVGNDPGLDSDDGTLNIDPAPANGHPLYRHGGFLKASKNGHQLTYYNGTPFYWLGDTWWNFPSRDTLFDTTDPLKVSFKKLVDTRVAQGYTVYQAHGLQQAVPGTATPVSVFSAVDATSDFGKRFGMGYWCQNDQYIQYAASPTKGLIGYIGFGTGAQMDAYSTDQLKRVFAYYFARYGAYPISFLLTQEYNVTPIAGRIAKWDEVGQMLYDLDPYKRALTAHPSVPSGDAKEFWNKPWMALILAQGGHFVYPSLSTREKYYQDAYATGKPFVQSEHNYEGFQKNDAKGTPTFRADAQMVRWTAIAAYQYGAAGFTYGAQGLYGSIVDASKPGTTANWGPVLTWKQGLESPLGLEASGKPVKSAGANYLTVLKGLYQSHYINRMLPVNEALMIRTRQTALLRNDGVYLVYYNPWIYGLTAPTSNTNTLVLPAGNTTALYDAELIDPSDRSSIGRAFTISATIDSKGRRVLAIPASRDLGMNTNEDFFLRLTPR